MFKIIDKESLKNVLDNGASVKIPYKECLDEWFSDVTIFKNYNTYTIFGINTVHNEFKNFDDAYLCFKKYSINLGIVQKYVQENYTNLDPENEDDWITLKNMITKLYKRISVENE